MILCKKPRVGFEPRSSLRRWKRSIWWTSFRRGWKRTELNPPGSLRRRMVNFGWNVEALGKVDEANAFFDLSIQWLGAGCLMMGLLSEIQQTTERISQIVRAMKSYTYLDQAPLLEVDIHEGLENTLVIMQHKLKQGVSIKREYSPDLPRIEAYASELNQVWTNIIDNAIDAMKGKGEISLRTYAEDDHVIVEITDNGPGIPENIQARIFEPFFTTKPPGHGTGLGLHISHDIIANRHHGQLLVESKPGEDKVQGRFCPGKIINTVRNPHIQKIKGEKHE